MKLLQMTASADPNEQFSMGEGGFGQALGLP